MCVSGESIQRNGVSAAGINVAHKFTRHVQICTFDPIPFLDICCSSQTRGFGERIGFGSLGVYHTIIISKNAENPILIYP